MRRIIHNKDFNTDMDRKLGSWNNGYFPQSLSYYAENLYVNRCGDYYLHKEGGPESPCRGAWGGMADGYGVARFGELIQELTESEAKTWAEKHLAPEV